MGRVYKSETKNLVNLILAMRGKGTFASMALMRRARAGPYKGRMRPTRAAVYLTMLLTSSHGWLRNSRAIDNKHLVPLQNAGILEFTRIQNSNNVFTLTLTKRCAYLKKLYNTVFPARMERNTEFIMTQMEIDEEQHAKIYREMETLAEQTVKHLALANETLLFDIKYGGNQLISYLHHDTQLKIEPRLWSSQTSLVKKHSVFAVDRLARFKALQLLENKLPDLAMRLIREMIAEEKGKLITVPLKNSVNTYFTSVILRI